MRILTYLGTIALLVCSSTSLSALDKIDEQLLTFAQSQPPREGLNIPALAKLLRERVPDDFKAAELAFYWITEHIVYDFNAEKINTEQIDLEKVLQTRRGNVQTFSQLYQELCQQMGLSCHLITGYVNDLMYVSDAEGRVEEELDGSLRDIPDRPYHSWNMVKIGDVYYAIDVIFGLGAVDGGADGDFFVKKYDLTQILVQEGNFFITHLPADPRWQMRERPISLHTYHLNIPFSEMESTHQSDAPYDYQAAITTFEAATDAEQRLMTLRAIHAYNASNFNLRQYADALYNMGYTQSLGDYDTQRLLSARKYYEQAIAMYKKVEDSPVVEQLMAQAEQGITYVAYRLDAKR